MAINAASFGFYWVFFSNDACWGVVMVAKRSSLALAWLLLVPSAALALGLGDIHLLSPLNSPLDAEIELVDVAPDEVNTVRAQLASRDTFARYGLEWPAFLANVQVRAMRAPDGRQIVKIRTIDPVSEPFVTILVEVNWSRGRLVREYTMLLDPPVYTPNPAAVSAAPVSAPATSAAPREGEITRAPSPPPPVASPAEPPPAAAASPVPPAPAPREAPAKREAPPAATAASTGAAESGTHLVHRGETLSQIAADVAGSGANSAKARSWIVAIYRANPRAFQQNMNVMHAGAVLRIPDAAAVAP